MAPDGAQACTGHGAPNLGSAVVGRGGHEHPVGGEGRGPDPVLVPGERQDALARLRAEDPDLFARGGNQDLPAVGREGRGVHHVVVSGQRQNAVAAGDVPDAHGAVERGGEEVVTRCREGRAAQGLRVAAESRQALAGLHLPDARSRIHGGGHEQRVVLGEHGGLHCIGVALEPHQAEPGASIPDGGRAVARRRGHVAAVGRKGGCLHILRVPCEFAQADPCRCAPNARNSVAAGTHNGPPVGRELAGVRLSLQLAQHNVGIRAPNLGIAAGGHCQHRCAAWCELRREHRPRLAGHHGLHDLPIQREGREARRAVKGGGEAAQRRADHLHGVVVLDASLLKSSRHAQHSQAVEEAHGDKLAGLVQHRLAQARHGLARPGPHSGQLCAAARAADVHGQLALRLELELLEPGAQLVERILRGACELSSLHKVPQVLQRRRWALNGVVLP
mmetsp:Transcript_21422/g.54620  ORF Transcript_21422/g.54620 Transcript_21422/m.54620 type:complete len:447 (+) Transcript_21422:221-1561(+)